MERKYYFRGLGLGVIVTALIMGIVTSGGRERELSDDEIIARAKELGMTVNTRLLETPEADEAPEGTEATEKDGTVTEPVKKDVAVAQPKEDAEEPEDGETEPSEADPEETAQQPAGSAGDEPQEDEASAQPAQNKKPATDTNEMTKQDEDTGQKTPSNESSSRQTTTAATSITIVSGDGSYTVAKKLEEAGLIFSASSYDDFLCQNGYDKRLRTGTFEIPAGASDEQIARIVTSEP